MIFALVNESTDPEVTTEWLSKVASALEKQTHDFGTMHETTDSVVCVETSSTSAADASILHLVDEIPEAPDALAYHTIDDWGRPVLRLGVKTIRASGGGLDEVSIACSHEILETIADPYCRIWNEYDADGSDGVKKVAYEVCDPVEGDSYAIDGVAVSNFVGPRWFDEPGSPGPFDFLGKLNEPMAMSPGGYLTFDDGSQVFGIAMPEWKRAQKRKYGRR